jgi:phage tail sheath protein FI
MAEAIVSPGVFQRETDQSFITPTPVEVGAAIVGPTVRGPVEQPTVVSSFADYKNKFGTTFVSASENLEFLTSIAVQKFFSNGGNSMLVTRVGSGSFTEATSTNIAANQGASSGLASGSLTIVTNFVPEDEIQITVNSNEFRFIAADPVGGVPVSNSPVFYFATGSSIATTIDSMVTAIDAAAIGVNATDGTSALQLTASLAGTLGNAIIVQTGSGATITTTHLTLGGGTDGGGDTAFTLKTLAEGVVLNNSTGATDSGVEFTDGSLKSGSLDNLRYEISGVNTLSGTFNISIRRGDDNTTNKIILETFVGCSLDPKADNYISKVIGDQYGVPTTMEGQTSIRINGDYPNRSKFVRVSSVALQTPDYLLNDGTIGINSSGNPFSSNLPSVQSGSFQGATGTNIPTGAQLLMFENISNINTQGLQASDYTTALNILKNKDEYRFATLALPGVYQGNGGVAGYAGAVAAAIELCEARGDCFYIADMVPYDSTVALVTAEAGELNTNFAGTYWPWVKVPSAELSRNVWAPASTVMQGVYAANDKVAAPWFAPAGLNRGGLPIVRTEFKVTQALRDKLYDNKVNPIATFPRVGPVAYGQKTLQKKASALDRINVRRLLISLKNFIGDTSKQLVFEQNTTVTRNRFLNAVNPFLESVQQRQGLFAFRVVMDESNNTADAIDRNQLVGQIFIQPTRTAEFIILDYTIQPTGATFND